MQALFIPFHPFLRLAWFCLQERPSLKRSHWSLKCQSCPWRRRKARKWRHNLLILFNTFYTFMNLFFCPTKSKRFACGQSWSFYSDFFAFKCTQYLSISFKFIQYLHFWWWALFGIMMHYVHLYTCIYWYLLYLHVFVLFLISTSLALETSIALLPGAEKKSATPAPLETKQVKVEAGTVCWNLDEPWIQGSVCHSHFIDRCKNRRIMEGPVNISQLHCFALSAWCPNLKFQCCL